MNQRLDDFIVEHQKNSIGSFDIKEKFTLNYQTTLFIKSKFKKEIEEEVIKSLKYNSNVAVPTPLDSEIFKTNMPHSIWSTVKRIFLILKPSISLNTSN